MTEATTSITIQAPPEAVWPWVADITRHGEWSPKPYRVEITEVVPTSRCTLKANDESGTFHIVFPKMKGVSAVMVPLLFPIVAKPDFRKRMALLKQKVESSG